MAIYLVTFSMSCFWSEPLRGIRVMPGRSTRVRSGQFWLWMVRRIGSGMIPLIWKTTFVFTRNFVGKFLYFLFHYSEVCVFYIFFIVKYLKYLAYFKEMSCTAQGVIFSVPGTWTSRNSRGLLVTTPSPRGRKSSPTMDSKRELLPLLYVPSTAIRGRFMNSWRPTSLSSSMIL